MIILNYFRPMLALIVSILRTMLIAPIVLFFGISSLAAGNVDNNEQVKLLTMEYIATLDSDLERQANFYTPETRFRDPTSDLFGPAWDIRGGDEIIQFFKTASEQSGTLTVEYKLTNMLIERSLVVANITSSVTSCGVGLGFPEKSFTGDIHMVMILQFEGKKILQRTDYVGYSAAGDKMDEIKLQLPNQPDDPRCR